MHDTPNRQPKPSAPTPEYGAPALPVYSRPGVKSVDEWGFWECPTSTCGRHNAAFRTECRVCYTPRPDTEAV